MLIGELYKKEVLTLPKKERKKFELPLNDGSTKIENDFFGWKLYYKKLGRKSEEHIECRSEEEARYIRVFMDLMAHTIYIPKDDAVIKKILPELERIHKKTDEILSEYLKSLFQRSLREKLKHMVYKDVLEGV